MVPMIHLSDDGYIRLTLLRIMKVPLVHLLSGLDEDCSESVFMESNVCEFSGYTEWVSSTVPVITIGWDWQIDVFRRGGRYVRVGVPRSNLMILDANQCDVGPIETAWQLENLIDAISWQEETVKAISSRYASAT